MLPSSDLCDQRRIYDRTDDLVTRYSVYMMSQIQADDGQLLIPVEYNYLIVW